jgi:hypothetical protein
MLVPMVTNDHPPRRPEDGVHTLARGRTHAVRAAAWAWSLAAAGDTDTAAEHATTARAHLAHADRRDRHAAAILLLATEGAPARAAGLACEHLAEFPNDRVVAFVVTQLADCERRVSRVSASAANDQRAPAPCEEQRRPSSPA